MNSGIVLCSVSKQHTNNVELGTSAKSVASIATLTLELYLNGVSVCTQAPVNPLPELVVKGYIYIAQPPLYRIKRGKREEYIDTEDQMNELLLEIGTDTLGLLEDSVFVKLDHRQGNRCADWMSGVSEAVSERRAVRNLVNESAVDRLTDHHSTHGDVRRSETFCHRHQIRFQVLVLTGKKCSRTTEPRNHFVDDKENAVLAPDVLHRGERAE